MRIGHGYDVHKLVENRKLILGGVHIPYEKGLLGHSDADVLAHAIADALLGAATLGDIGVLFPDDDPQYADADSLKLLGWRWRRYAAKALGLKISMRRFWHSVRSCARTSMRCAVTLRPPATSTSIV